MEKIKKKYEMEMKISKTGTEEKPEKTKNKITKEKIQKMEKNKEKIPREKKMKTFQKISEYEN